MTDDGKVSNFRWLIGFHKSVSHAEAGQKPLITATRIANEGTKKSGKSAL
jgi:hypothetical protein